MKYMPLFMNLDQQPCLVVGGGPIAARKTELLLKASAKVNCVALDFADRFQQLLQQYPGHLNLVNEAFGDSQIDHQRLVVAATDDSQLNKNIAKLCRSQGIPCNTVSDGQSGDFIFPAIIDRSPVIAAVSSGGEAPVLTRLLRGKIESVIPSAFGHLASLASHFRQEVKRRLPNIASRRKFWETTLTGTVAEQVFIGNTEIAEKIFAKALAQAEKGQEKGEVYLVGAGPGDPDLLTFKALRLMQQADVVLYDALVSQPILDLVKRDAELIYVGKRKKDHAVPQQDINQLLIDHAKLGKRVLRLKGGDPFIFGRGGEEIEGLMEEGLEFQVVPGITAANGCAAYSGIPLTHRDYSQSVRFITGHLKDGSTDLPWQEFVYPAQTLVFYMGLGGLKTICEKLVEAGRAVSTPVALIQKGTTPQQRVITSDLANMPEMAIKEKIQAPTLIVIGDVVQLHEKLSWFSPDQIKPTED